MKRKLTLSILLPLSAAVLTILTASAIGDYTADWWTADGGGGMFSQGGSYSLGGTVGQADAGPAMGGGSYSLVGGFWAGAQATVLPPEVVTISRTDPNPTGAASVDFTVVFSQSVTGVDSTDLVLTVTGLSDTAITGVSSGPASTYTVTVDTGTGSGTIRLDLLDDDSILAEVGALPLGGTGTGNGDFMAGEAYDVIQINISGNAGVRFAELSYGGPETAVADLNGDYSFSVPYNWSGTVTPSLVGHTFEPASIVYSELKEDQVDQNYVATVGPAGPQILKLYPPENSQACRRPNVGVRMLLANLVRTADGSFDPSTITLTLDGINVLGSARITQDMAFPPTRATILYTPPANLGLGAHQVVVTYPTPSGTASRVWNFTAATMTCE